MKAAVSIYREITAVVTSLKKKGGSKMPGYDGSGPAGAGAGTGRGLGPCLTGKTPWAYGIRGPLFGRGMGRGAGRGPGRGFCRWWPGAGGPYYGPVQHRPEDERAYLKDQAEMLKSELAEMEKRMAELEEGKR